MTIELGLTQDDLTNTEFAPVAFLSSYYQQHKVLEPLGQVYLAQQVSRWDSAGSDAFVGFVEPPMVFSQPIRIVVKKMAQKGSMAAPLLCDHPETAIQTGLPLLL